MNTGYDIDPTTNRFGYETHPTTCRYCHASVFLVDDRKIYGRSYGGKVYLCSRAGCLARVGCHEGTDQALGTLAREELRELRKQCHVEFDEVWKAGVQRRKDMYRWMQKVLGLTRGEAHIGCLDEAHCRWLLESLRTFVPTLTPSIDYDERIP